MCSAICFGSVAAIGAAGVILWTGWSPIDPLLSALVALLILRSALMLVRKSAHILLEGTPEWLDVDALRADLENHVPAIRDVHHVHAWMLTQEKVLMTLHVAVADGADTGPVLDAVQDRLRETYGVDHATIQIEAGGHCPPTRSRHGVKRYSAAITGLGSPRKARSFFSPSASRNDSSSAWSALSLGSQ